MRGTGLGSEILDIIKKKYDGKCIVLNAEVPDDKADNSRQRVSRIKFYEKNGFKDAECGYKDISGEYVTLYSGYEFPYGSFCLICNSYPAKFYGTKAGY